MVSRGKFLKLGVAGLAGVLFSPGAPGCGSGGPEDPEGTMVSEPEELETMQQTVEISTPRGKVHGVFYPADGARGAVVMVGGAGGGIHGPSGIYEEFATLLQTEGATALRLEYRTPNHLDECVYDVLAALAALGDRGVDRTVLVGWSFGGAVVISAGAESEAVVGIATVASQTYGAGAVRELSPEKSLLLMHGTADQVLPDRLSRDLYARAGEPKELVAVPR
ncbi:MAG: alpha/beta hydrolase [Actinomycetota bacterium]|nr:alpha/beta hydrolase [Actinomycetota bacterium]